MNMKRPLVTMGLFAALLASLGVAQRGSSALAVNGQPVSQAALAAAPRYTITDLGTLGGDTSQAYRINRKGHVVGLAKLNAQIYHAFFWDGETMTDLGTLGGPQSSAADINDAGQVVGVSHVSGGKSRAFLWQNGVMQNLGTIGGDSSGASGINSAGQVVGWDSFTGDYSRAFLWQNGSMQLLGTFGGHSFAEDINDAGQVVGYSSDGSPSPQTHAFLWQNGVMQDLGTLGGDTSRAWAINDAGQVVGSSDHAFVWRNGSMQNLGTLGGSISDAYDINDAGQVVGQSLTASQGYRAFLWENDQMKDLNTLIPADSGWVLREARAINKRGQIVGYGTHNGQPRGFLLTPLAYNWINPNGGSWHTAANWDPQGIPGDSDTTIFDLAGEYTVDASEPPLARLSPSSFAIDRMVISSTATVNFNNLNLNLVFDSPDSSSLQVNERGTANLNSGAATYSHAIIGGLEPDDPDNPPTARLQVFNSGTTLTGSGRLTIGHLGVGDLFVANGGHLTSAEARLGGDQPGSATVGGDGSRWQTGDIAVGYGVSGTLTIENGGRVDSNTAVIGFGDSTQTSAVKVDFDAPSPGQVSLWAVEENLTIGQSGAGLVDVGHGGQLVVNQNVSILDGMLKVMGRTTTNSASLVEVMGSVLVGGPNTGVLFLDDGARGNIHGDLIVGQDGIGHVYIAGGMDATSRLDVKDPTSGTCLIGREFPGRVVMTGVAYLDCRNIQLGLAGTGGAGRVEMDGGYLSAGEIVRVGQVGSGSGQIELKNGATIVAGEGMYVTPNGAVIGSGYIYLGTIGLVNEGTLSPAINVTVVPLANAPQRQDRTQDFLATMEITGALTISPTGRLEVPITGSNAGEYGGLKINGSATLDGVLALAFRDGYAPSRGDTFTFLTATGALAGVFDSVEISGLPPGFQYELTIVDGQLVLVALSDGIPSQRIFLPLVMTRP